MKGTFVKTFTDFKCATNYILKREELDDFVQQIFTLKYIFHETSLSMIWHVTVYYDEKKKEV